MKLKWAVPLVFLLVVMLRLAGVAQNYAPVTNYPTGTAPIGLAQGDFNEDGKPDIAVANVSAGSISILPGSGDGTFGPATAILTGSSPYSVASADLNGDGHLDLVVSLTSGQDFAVLFGKGNGQFQAPNTFAISGLPAGTTVGQVVVKDLNGDGKPDIVFATDRGVAVFVNSGTGSFTQANSVDPANVVANVAVVDLDRDGILDLVATEATFDVDGNPTGSLIYALGHGDGTFAPVVNITDLTGPPTGLAIADVNHDGFLDIITSFASSTTGTGGPPTKPTCPTPRICLPQDGGTGTTPVPGGIAKILQTAKLQFSTPGRILGDQNPGFLVTGDLDGDGNLDVAEASNNQPAVVIFRGNGDGTFGLPISLTIPSIAFEIATGSFTQTSALDLFSSDNATNQVSVFVNQGANTLSMVSSANPSALFQQVTLTATVQPKFPSAGTLSGSVIFSDGGTTLGSAAVNSSGVSTLAATFSTTGDHPLTAVYSGNSSFAGGSSAQLVQRVAIAPSITLSSSLNPSVVGQAVNFTVVVTAGGTGPAPTGTVTLSSSGAPLVSGTIDASGRAVLSTSSLPVGSNNLIAQYSGDSNYPGVQSAQLVQVVNKSNSNTVLTSSANPSVFGQPVNFAITVSASSPGGRTPSGNVTLKDAGAAISTATLDNTGAAVITVSNLAVGTHSLTVDYAGDSNFNASSSATVSQVVTTVSTSTSLSSSPNPSGVGQAVTLTALVKPALGTAAPSGVVVFSDGATVLGSANLDATGSAVLAVSSLAVGSHNLTASYAGNSGFHASTSAVLTQVVSSSVVKIVFNSSVNPAAFGQSVSLTATISAASPGTNKIPTGTVNFLDGAAVLGQAPIDSAGNAVFTTASLSVGTHTLSVSYAGDSNFSSGSASLSEVINKASTSTNLTSSLNPATSVSSILLHATVSSTTGPASGSVQFFDGAVQVGSSVLDASSSASLALSSLGIGTHVLTAAYVGSPNFANSTSSINETVIDSHSHVLLASSANPQTFSQPVTFTATVTPALTNQVVSGTIIFHDGTQVLATLPVSNGAAMFSTTHLAVGTHVITAAYLASTTPGPFDGSSAPLAEVIQSSNAPDYAVSVKPGYGSVVPGAVFYTTVTVAPLNGFTGVVTLGCDGLPANAVCVFQPAQVEMNGQASTVSRLEIVTTGPYVAPGPNKPSYPLPRPSPAMWLMPGLLGCVMVGGRKRSRAAVGLCILACAMMIGCGGSSKSFDQPHVYNVTVTASSGNVLHSATLQLTLQ